MLLALAMFPTRLPPSTSIPQATSGRLSDPASATLVITADRVTLDGIEVTALEDFRAPIGWGRLRQPLLLMTLYDRLLEKAECSKCLHGHGEFRGRIHIYADPDTPAELISRVVYTCGQAQFGEIGFVVQPG